MDVVELDVFLADVEVELPACPVPVIERRIRETAIEICEETNLWLWQHPPIPMVDGQGEYTLSTPTTEAQILALMQLRKDGELLLDYSTQMPPRRLGARWFTMPVRHRIRLLQVSADASTSTLEPLLTLKPTRNAETLPAFLHTDHHDLVMLGTLYRALRMRERPWSDRQLSEDYRTRYGRDMKAARRAVDAGLASKNVRVYAQAAS